MSSSDLDSDDNFSAEKDKQPEASLPLYSAEGPVLKGEISSSDKESEDNFSVQNNKQSEASLSL
jgi:hypothetical protein